LDARRSVVTQVVPSCRLYNSESRLCQCCARGPRARWTPGHVTEAGNTCYTRPPGSAGGAPGTSTRTASAPATLCVFRAAACRTCEVRSN
jgi:hypothetical protein